MSQGCLRRKVKRAKAAARLLLLLRDAPCYLNVEIINLNRVVSAYFSLSGHEDESPCDIIQSLMAAAPSYSVPSNATSTLMTLLTLRGDEMTKTSLRWALEDAFTLLYHFLERTCLQKMPSRLENQLNPHNQIKSEMFRGLSTLFRATVRAGKQQIAVSSHCFLDVFAFNAWVSFVALTACCTHTSIDSLSAIRINTLLTEMGKIMSTQLTYLPSKTLIEMLRFVIITANSPANFPKPFDSVGLGLKSFLEHAIFSRALTVDTNLPILLTPGWLRCKRGCTKLLLILVQAHANADCLCDFVIAAIISLASPPSSSLQFKRLNVIMICAIKLATEKVPCYLTRRALCKLRQLANLPSTAMNFAYVQCCDTVFSSAFERFSTKPRCADSISNALNITETVFITMCGNHELWQTTRTLIEKSCWIIQSTLSIWDTRSRTARIIKGANFGPTLKLASGRILEMAMFIWLHRGTMHGLLMIFQLNKIAIHACRSPNFSERLHRPLVSALLAAAMFDRTSRKFILETAYHQRVFFFQKVTTILFKYLANVATEFQLLSQPSFLRCDAL